LTQLQPKFAAKIINEQSMSLQEEINSIINDGQLSYDEKSKKLQNYLTPHEVRALLQKPIDVVKLKEPLVPKTKDMRVLHLSVYNEIFEEILKGGHIECRDYNEYYKSRCTYVENGVRYLVPFDAITFYVGRGNNAKRATVAVKDIILDDGLLYFHLGDVLEINVR
jgi:hypothetical protein